VEDQYLHPIYCAFPLTLLCGDVDETHSLYPVHVVFGCAGNSAAVFPMRRLGMEVWPINTVQFSNHTQYAAGWQGMAMPAGHISALCEGLSNIEVLAHCDAVLSGYLGSAEQGDEILAVVAAVKAANPAAIYFCDP
jgi:pyridoxine kinase